MRSIRDFSTIFIIILIVTCTLVISAPTGDVYDDGDDIGGQRGTAGFKRSTVHTTVVNLNDTRNDDLLKNFNISKGDILRRLSELNKGELPPTTIDPNNGTEPSRRNDDQRTFIDALRRGIESAVDRNNSRGRLDLENLSDNFQDDSAIIHQLAFVPVCSKNNDTTWLGSNTAKLYFSPNIFDKLNPNTRLNHATLRLWQKRIEQPSVDSNPNPLTGCSEPDNLLRITISVMVKRLIAGEIKEKKRVCSSFMTYRKLGWVGIDVSQVMKVWEKEYRHEIGQNRDAITDPMLLIDVEDEQQNPLKAGLLFDATDCQASLPLPWSLFNSAFRDNSESVEMSHSPRIDITYSRLNHHYTHYHRVVRRNRNYARLVQPIHYYDDNQQSEFPAMQSNFNYLSHDEHEIRNHHKRHTSFDQSRLIRRIRSIASTKKCDLCRQREDTESNDSQQTSTQNAEIK